MVPPLIVEYLRDRYAEGSYRVRSVTEAAGSAPADLTLRVAKVVVFDLGGEPAMAVVAASDRVNLRPIEESTGLPAQPVSGGALADRLRPCEPGAAAPLGLFGMPIYADAVLLRALRIVVPAGTHQDAAEVVTAAWTWSERVRPITNLGRRARRRWRVGEPSWSAVSPR